MRKLSVVLVACLFLAGCVPSLSYRLGQGFYSETLSKSEMQDLIRTGKAKSLGKFTAENGGCFLYSQDTADQKVVIPAIQEKLKEMGGNVADNVVANEKGYDFLLGLLILPGFAGCSNWTISGDAFRVDKTALLGGDQSVIFFR